MLYLSLSMGAAGDMIMAALLELYEKQDEFLDKINSIGIPHTKVSLEKVQKCGIFGTSLKVEILGEEEGQSNNEHHHHHSTLENISHIINHLKVSDKVKSDAAAIYAIIAAAEAKAHNTTVDLVHFHEIGALDAVCDIGGCCMLFELLDEENIICSPLTTGFGFVKCAHGILPVPAPATAEILCGIPLTSGNIEGELCTPTGAAIIKYFAKDFSQMPTAKVRKIGYGMGKKDFLSPNCVRAFICDENKTDTVCEIVCNIDDMSSEELSLASEFLFENGALDVFFTPVYMKKSRPAYMLTCLCKPCNEKKFATLILSQTTTIGVRISICERYILHSEYKKVQTKYGDITVKESNGYGIKKSKAEYDDLKAAALANNVTLREVINSLQ